MAVELKFSKFDNTPWGFRLTGGSDYGIPLTVVKVSEGSLSEQMGLRDSDIIIRINDIDTSNLTHEEANEVILLAGNNFVATIVRQEFIPEALQVCMMPLDDIQSMNPQPSLVNGVDQVPIYGTRITLAYKHFSDTAINNIPPLENPLILNSNHTDEFQTINQQEWKETSKNLKTTISKKAVVLNETISQQMSSEENKIDITKIEESAKDMTIEEAFSNSTKTAEESKSQNGEGSETITFSLNNKKKTKQCTEEVLSSDKKCQIEESKVSNKATQITKSSEEVTLQDAKIKAINAANVLSEQAKLNGISSFEGTKMGTVNAFKCISQNIKQNCFKVPCDVAQMKTQCHTDMILKTFFIHLTDVMVALTHMIICEDESNKCENHSSHYCPCMNVMNEKLTKQNVESEVIKTSNIEQKSSQHSEEENKVVQESHKMKDKVEQFKTSSNGQVLKEVIQNIQTATGVDVTVNGKDPLEWLADLDNKEKSTSVTKEAVLQKAEEHVATETKSIQLCNKNQISEENITAASNVNIQSEKVAQFQEIIAVSENKIENTNTCETQSQNIVQHLIEKNEITKVERKRLSSGEINTDWEVKVVPNAPDTPNTEEYLFKLDVKLNKFTPSAEPTIHEDWSIVRRSDGTEDTETSYEMKKAKMKNARPSSLNIKEIREKIKPKPPIEKTIIESETTIESNTITSEYEKTNTQTQNFASINAVDVNATNINNSTTASLDVTEYNTKDTSSSFVKDASAISTSESIVCSAIANDISSFIPASSSIINASATYGIVTTAATDANTHVSLVSQHQQEHETVIQKMKENILVAESNASEEKHVDFSKQIMQLENNEQNTFTERSEQTVCNENITMELPAEVLTMGEGAKNFATVNNAIQNISNGDAHISETFNGISDDDLGKPGLPDEEIVSIISGEHQYLKEQHKNGLQKVLASHMRRPDEEINNMDESKMTPVVGFLRDSEVFKALNEESLQSKAEKIQEERKKWTTFLQKPNRPIPYCKRLAEQLAFEEPPYKVNIKPQPKKQSTDSSSILTEGVFLIPEVPILVPEPPPEYYEAPEYLADSAFPDLEDTGIPLPQPSEPKMEEESNAPPMENGFEESENKENCQENGVVEDEKAEQEPMEQEAWNDPVIYDKTIDESLSMEEQLARVQQQLVALSKLPATIQQTIEQVTKQLSKMVPHPEGTEKSVQEKMEVANQEQKSQEVANQEEQTQDSTAQEEAKPEEANEIPAQENTTAVENGVANDVENETLESTQTVDDAENNTEIEKQIETPRVDEIKPCVTLPLMDEQKHIEKMKKDLMNELHEEHVMRQLKQRPGGRVGRPQPAFGPLTPQERPIVLPGGRKWKGPKDAFTDSFIAETLSGQAEVIMGKTLGVNFMKYAKPPITLEHLKNSSVFKMVHDMDEPLQGIYHRPPVVLAESEFREKCRSITPNSFNQDFPMEAES